MRHNSASTTASQDAPPAKPPAWARRRWGLRLLLAVGAPLCCLLGLEGALRLAGYGHPTTFFLGRVVNGQPAWVDNWQFGWRFFPRAAARMPYPLVMSKSKPGDTRRIFVMGESAALGDPSPEFGFSRLLQVLLRARFPAQKFEVINVAMVAINSHAVLPIARECARRDGDLWVIYLGNNEVVGPFGAAGVFGATAPPVPVVRANLALKSTRVGQLLEAGIQSWRRGAGGPPQWEGMQAWKEAVRRDDPRIRRVHAHFQENLKDIVRIGRRAGVPMILSTVGCNLKDCSPFASVHRSGLTPGQQAQWDLAYHAGAGLEAAEKFAEALAQYQVAAQLDDQFAELQFRLGTCNFALGETNAAREHFQRAKDHDALQFRPDSRLNEIIRELGGRAADPGVRLLDAAELFARHSAGGIPGGELFYEHVHLTPAGNYLLAKATAELAAELIPGNADAGPATKARPWLSQAECEARLGLTDWGRFQTLQLLRERLAAPPFTGQSIHSNQMQSLGAAYVRLRRATYQAPIRQAVQTVQAAVDRDPADAELLKILAPMLEAAGDPLGAEQRWREVVRRLPHAAIPHLNLARLLERQGRDDDAAQAYEQCLHLNPDVVEARGDLGSLRLRQGRVAEAIPQLRRVVQQQPQSVTGRWLLGQALLQANQRTEAAAHLKEVVRLDPNHSAAKQMLLEISGGP